MNIAIFTETYTPQINGVVVSIETFRKELEREGHRVYIFAPRFKRGVKDTPFVRRVYSIPYLWKAMREQRFCIPFPWDLKGFRKLKIDVIHAQVTASNTGYLALLAGAVYGIPVVHTYHTLFIEYVHYTPLPTRIAKRGVIYLSRYYCNACRRVIVPSSVIIKELRSYGVKKPIDVIPTGIDRSLLSNVIPFSRERYGIPSERRIITFIGRSAREKNIPFLFQVQKLLHARSLPVHLVLIGDGPEREALERQADGFGLSEWVTFTGYLPREEVFGILKDTEVFTSCSMTETQGIVILEALTFGVPVVAIASMGVIDMLKDRKGGVLTPANPEIFSEEVYRLLTEPDLHKRTSREALEKSEHWDSRTTALKLLDCYSKAVGENPGKSSP